MGQTTCSRYGDVQMTDRELLGLAAKAGRCAVSASKTVRQIPMPMDDKIEAWVQQAMQLAEVRNYGARTVRHNPKIGGEE